MSLHKLLMLLPRFKDTVQSLTIGHKQTTLRLYLTTLELEPALIDSQNPAVKLFIKGREVHRCIIDGGSGVNVISEATCHDLGITQWEACLFWLHMVDMRSVRPIGLIRNLDFILGGHLHSVHSNLTT